MIGTAVYFEGVACVAHGSRWVSDLRRGGGGGGVMRQFGMNETHEEAAH